MAATSSGVEQAPQHVHLAVGDRGEPLAQRGVDRVAGELPDDGAELVVDVEAQPVVDRPAPAVLQQHVPGLAIGVVRHDVERRERAEPVRQPVLAAQREVVLDALLVHPALDGARAEVASSRAIVSGTQSVPNSTSSS